MTVMTRGAATAVGELLRYPQNLREQVLRNIEELESAPEVQAHVRAFWDEVSHVLPEGLEELYTTTFDLNPVATLEVGWHVWGEQYERGRFLADLRPLQARHGIEEGTELPDHLTVLLPLVERMDRFEATPILEHIDKAAAKILEPLDRNGNPYRHLIRAALASLNGGCA
jgi:nitrate reductase molybdenum cofactor assembly chaperone NarJ/NarW